MGNENNTATTGPIDADFIEAVQRSLRNAPKQKLEALFRYGRESMHSEAGKWSDGRELLPGLYITPHFANGPVASRIRKLLYELHLIIPFDWMHWKTGMDMLRDDDLNRLSGLPAPDLVALLTLLVRKDRFAEGTWGDAVQRHMVAKLLSELDARIQEQYNAPDRGE